MPERPTKCVYCGGPLPPPALTGRPRSFCSAPCRRANEEIAVSLRREQMWQRQRREEERQREKTAREKARREEQEYQRTIKAGGDEAAWARWNRLDSQTLEKTHSSYGLCQWQDERENGSYAPRMCTRRTADVYCGVHDRQLEREQEQARAAATQGPSDG